MRKLIGAGLAALTLVAGPLSAQEAPVQNGSAEPYLEYVFEEIVKLDPPISPGETGRGGRNIIPIIGGSFEGPDLRGEVLPGGWDWQLKRADGCTDVVADYFLKTDDGVVINVRNTGAICPPEEGAAFAVRTHPVFEAPIGKYDWLSKTAFIGTLDPVFESEKLTGVKIRFYRVR